MNEFITLTYGHKCTFKVPARLANHYSMKYENLGTGSYGTVLKFKSLKRGKPDIAIKMFTTPFQSVAWARLALRELNILNNTSQDNVVRLLGAYGIEDCSNELESVYHITAYCGRTLREVINNERLAAGGKRYSMRQVKSMMTDLLRACKYLNSADVIHRDVKPENMCIDENWKLTLLDFGLARVIDKNNQMTAERGTHPYMSIEMMDGWSGVYDEKVDVWSIGAILCELLTGETLFGMEKPRHPLDAAIKICGPVPNNALDQIEKADVRARLKKDSKGAERIDFAEYLRDNGREWLSDVIAQNNDDLVDFVDYALQFDPELRMPVDFALAHRLLAEVRDLPREIIADRVVPEEAPLPAGEAGIVESKRRIREEISAAPSFLE